MRLSTPSSHCWCHGELYINLFISVLVSSSCVAGLTTCIYSILQVTTSLGHYFIKADRRSDRVLLGYSPTLSKWHRIAFDFLPMQIQPAASAGGLVCLVADYRPFALFVCNPITKVARQLPPRICKRRPRIVCMVVDRLAKTYKIIAAGGYRTDDDRWTTEVFDSVTSLWRVSGSLLQEELTKRAICCRFGHLHSYSPHLI